MNISIYVILSRGILGRICTSEKYFSIIIFVSSISGGDNHNCQRLILIISVNVNSGVTNCLQ